MEIFVRTRKKLTAATDEQFSNVYFTKIVLHYKMYFCQTERLASCNDLFWKISLSDRRPAIRVIRGSTQVRAGQSLGHTSKLGCLRVETYTMKTGVAFYTAENSYLYDNRYYYFSCCLVGFLQYNKNSHFIYILIIIIHIYV